MSRAGSVGWKKHTVAPAFNAAPLATVIAGTHCTRSSGTEPNISSEPAPLAWWIASATTSSKTTVSPSASLPRPKPTSTCSQSYRSMSSVSPADIIRFSDTIARLNWLASIPLLSDLT